MTENAFTISSMYHQIKRMTESNLKPYHCLNTINHNNFLIRQITLRYPDLERTQFPISLVREIQAYLQMHQAIKVNCFGKIDLSTRTITENEFSWKETVLLGILYSKGESAWECRYCNHADWFAPASLLLSKVYQLFSKNHINSYLKKIALWIIQVL